MALEPDFLSMTNDTVTVINPASTMTAYGTIVGSTVGAISYPAYIDMTPHEVLNSQGVEEVASGMIFVLSSSADIGLQHTVELSDGRKPELLRVEPLRDEDGLHHTTISFR